MINDMLAILSKYSYVFVEGIKWTIVLSVITIFFGTILGTLITFMKMSRNKILNADRSATPFSNPSPTDTMRANKMIGVVLSHLCFR